MSVRFYREYRLKFYLNARHYIIINENRGDVHPHTWEFALNIRIEKNDFVEFHTFEKEISDYLNKYQNCILNEHEPFDMMLPTLENMTDYFSMDFYRIICEMGGTLTSIEAGETPTRSYILNMQEETEEINQIDDFLNWSEMIDSVLDEME